MPTFSRLHMYLEVADKSLPIVGDSTDLDFLRQIRLTGFSWKLVRQPHQESNSRPQPEVFTFTKSMDKASTQMLTRLTTGTKLNAIVTLVGYEESSFKFRVKLSNVRIFEYKVNGKDGDKSGEVDEDWGFNYDTVDLQYTPELKGSERTAKSKSSSHRRIAQASTERSASPPGSAAASKVSPPSAASLLTSFASLTSADQKKFRSDFSAKFPPKSS